MIGLVLLGGGIFLLILVPIFILARSTSSIVFEDSKNMGMAAPSQDRFAHIVARIVTFAADNSVKVIDKYSNLKNITVLLL